MKKLFTLAAVTFVGLSSTYAQDTSNWKEGQDVTKEIQWKAYEAADEDPANPVWQGFQYGGPGEWEFRPAGTPSLDFPPNTGDGNTNTNFICWGAYNLPEWNVYQEFEMPAGIYTLSVAGCYREGSTGPTFDLWAAGKSTQNCFLYATVGNETYQTPMIYMFEGAQTSALTSFDSWMADCHFTNKEGVEIYGPSCHSGADNFIENGNYNNNKVTFIVPEKTTVRVGINKPVAQAQDQGWWNHWKMEYVMAYNEETSKAFLAYQSFQTSFDKYQKFAEDVILEYGYLGGLMNDNITDCGDLINNKSTLAEIQKATETLENANALNHEAYTKAKSLSFNIEVCNGIMKNTNEAFAGANDFQKAIEEATAMANDEEGATYESIEDFVQKAGALNKARIAYLMTQEKAADGSIDLTHAVSTPWFVNQEYTPHLQYVTENGTPVYQFPDEVEALYFGEGSPGDECINLENGKYGTAANEPQNWNDELTPHLSDKAHWTTDTSVENQWIYEDKWQGWHGGFAGYIQKLKGYAAWYSAWAAGANPNGAMKIYQVVTDIPDGFYTLEGRLFASEGGTTDSGDDLTFATHGNEYLFMNDAQGNEIAQVKLLEPLGFWSFWGRNDWRTLKTDFVQVSGGKITIGYNHNDMAGNAGVVLKFYGSTIDYSGLVQEKLTAAGGPDNLWPADKKVYEEMLAKVQLPVSSAEAYQEACGYINEAVAFKSMVKGKLNAYTAPKDFEALMNKYEEGDAPQIAILEQGWNVAYMLGDEDSNDSYTDIPPVVELYNEYVNYINAYDRAYNMNSEKIKPTLEKQTAALQAAPGTVESLIEYQRELQTPVNEAIFEQLGADDATEEKPAEITSLLVNPSFAEGPKTGWTMNGWGDGDAVDMTVNTYGRELAESWNRQPFEISQTLRALPAGTYEVRVHACYRDGGAVDQNMVNRFAAAAGDYSVLENNNAVLFANASEEYVKSVVDCAWTDPSFTQWWNAKGVEPAPEGFMADWDGTICILPGEESVLSEDDKIELIQNINLDNPGYPFDTKVGDNFYPSSMAGFKLDITRNPEVYFNTVRVYVEKGGDLKIGLRKNAAVGGDWLIYDDFQLWFLGNDPSTGVKDINAVENANAPVYNVAGQRVSDNYKGIVIKGGKKYMNK